MAMNLLNPIQYLRATKAAIAQRIGKMGEMNYAYDVHELYAHDGVTPGGWLIGGGTPWWKETGAYNIYMSTTGSDDNDGLTPETAVATLQRALLLSTKYTYGAVVPRINIQSGTYDIGLVLVGEYIEGSRYVQIVGTGINNVILQGFIDISRCKVYISKLSILPRIDQLSMIQGRTPAFVHAGACSASYIDSIKIDIPTIESNDNTVYRAILSDTNAFTVVYGDCYIGSNSSKAYLLQAATMGSMALVGNLQISGVCKYAIHAGGFGTVYFSGAPTITGSVTGAKYFVANFGLLNLLGQGANAIPASDNGVLGEFGLVV